MNYDAQEAALGLLSLSPSTTFIQPVPLATPNPLKRKQHPQTNHQASQRQNSSKGRSKQTVVAEKEKERHKERQKSKEDVEREVGDVSSESIRCICGSTFDDGFSIACDDCSRWCHAACFDIAEGSVPEQWSCWVCVPRPVDQERAAKLQRSRQQAMEDAERERLALLSQSQQHRRSSPGVDRKHRRVSAPAIEGSKKRRRMSTISTQPPPVSIQHPNLHPSTGEDTPVDVCTDADEPRSHYVHITEDIVSSSSTMAKLRQHAQNWRGITALTPYPAPPNSTPITLQPLPETTSVRPPSYALHTTLPVPSNTLLAPFPSTITPSAEYLSDPLNGYAHLGMPKPHVHLMGPPLDLALDARITGNEARFVRSGCWPNAVLRPVLCKRSKDEEKEKAKAWNDLRSSRVGGGELREKEDKKYSDDQTTLAFAVFALRDLKANEEVVLGWEWDDGNAVHALPALLQTPHMFPPAHVQHLRSQLANILHALGSTFTTCACGEKAKGCAIREMEAFVDGGSSLGGERASNNGGVSVGADVAPNATVHLGDAGMKQDGGNHIDAQTGSSHLHQQRRPEHDQHPRQRHHHHRHATLHDTSVNVAGPSTLRSSPLPPQPINLGPLLGVERGFRTRERVAWAGGMGGVEMVGGVQREKGRPKGNWAGNRRGGARSRPVVDGEAMEIGNEDGETDAKGEAREGIQGSNEDGDVNVDEDIDVEMSGEDDFSTNRAVRPATKTVDSQRKPRLPDAGVFRLRTEDGGSQRVRIIVPGEGRVGWASTGEYNLGPDWRKDEPRHNIEDGMDEDEVESEQEETKMPPKMRKRWIHQELEALRETYGLPSGSKSRNGPGVESDRGRRELSPTIAGPLETMEEPSEDQRTKESPTQSEPAEDGGSVTNSMDVDTQSMPPPPASLSTTPSDTIRENYRNGSSESTHGSHNSPPAGTTPPAASPSVSFSRLSLVSPTISSLISTTQAPSEAPRNDVPPLTPVPTLNTPRDSTTSPTVREALEEGPPEILEKRPVTQLSSPLSTHPSLDDSSLTLEVDPSAQSTPEESKLPANSSLTDKPPSVVRISIRDLLSSPTYHPKPLPAPTVNIQPDDMMQPSETVDPEENLSFRDIVPEDVREQSTPSPSPEVPPPLPQTTLADSPESPPPQHSPSQTPPPHEPSPPPRSPTPPPPPKVKMSLKDFAARKRKQREELESIGGGSIEASPMVAESTLAPDTDGDARPNQQEPPKPDTAPEPPAIIAAVPNVPQEAEVQPKFTGKESGREALDVVTNRQVKNEDVEMSVDNSENRYASPTSAPATNTTSPAPSTSTITNSPTVSLQAKMELVDQTIPERLTTSPHPSPRAPMAPSTTQHPIPTSQPSHEEGEILGQQDDRRPGTQRPQPLPARTSFIPPHSHTPPTQPRSFQTHGYSPPPRNHPPYRTPVSTPPPATPMVPPNSRPLPSGPRALRMASQPYQPARPASRSFSGPQAPPRGPSADRDRMDWDRDRSWQPRARTRGGGWAR